MKKLYLIGMVVVFLMILFMVLPQVAASCSWYMPFSTTTNPALALFQATGLGAILGGCGALYWKSSKEMPMDDADEGAEAPEKPGA